MAKATYETTSTVKLRAYPAEAAQDHLEVHCNNHIAMWNALVEYARDRFRNGILYPLMEEQGLQEKEALEALIAQLKANPFLYQGWFHLRPKAGEPSLYSQVVSPTREARPELTQTPSTWFNEGTLKEFSTSLERFFSSRYGLGNRWRRLQPWKERHPLDLESFPRFQSRFGPKKSICIADGFSFSRSDASPRRWILTANSSERIGARFGKMEIPFVNHYGIEFRQEVSNEVAKTKKKAATEAAEGKLWWIAYFPDGRRAIVKRLRVKKEGEIYTLSLTMNFRNLPAKTLPEASALSAANTVGADPGLRNAMMLSGPVEFDQAIPSCLRISYHSVLEGSEDYGAATRIDFAPAILKKIARLHKGIQRSQKESSRKLVQLKERKAALLSEEYGLDPALASAALLTHEREPRVQFARVLKDVLRGRDPSLSPDELEHKYRTVVSLRQDALLALPGAKAYLRLRKKEASRKLRKERLIENARHHFTSILAYHSPTLEALALEDTGLSGMLMKDSTKESKNLALRTSRPRRGLAKSSRKRLSLLGHGEIRRQLDYKFKAAGKRLEMVPAPYTSKTCCRCGHRQEMPRHRRVFRCQNPECVLHHEGINRDANAAFNMRDRALMALQQASATLSAVKRKDYPGSRRESDAPSGGKPPQTAKVQSDSQRGRDGEVAILEHLSASEKAQSPQPPQRSRASRRVIPKSLELLEPNSSTRAKTSAESEVFR